MKLSNEEKQLLDEAHRKREWADLKTWKLRYLYQRYIALPKGKTNQVIEIGQLASSVLGKVLRPSVAISQPASTEEAKEDLPF